MKARGTRPGVFKKGTSGNPSGRPKGTPNKINERIRETIHAALDETSGDVVGWIRRLGKEDPKGALQVYAALAEFALPKLSRMEAQHTGERDFKVIHRWGSDGAGTTVLLPASFQPDEPEKQQV